MFSVVLLAHAGCHICTWWVGEDACKQENNNKGCTVTSFFGTVCIIFVSRPKCWQSHLMVNVPVAVRKVSTVSTAERALGETTTSASRECPPKYVRSV